MKSCREFPYVWPHPLLEKLVPKHLRSAPVSLMETLNWMKSLSNFVVLPFCGIKMISYFGTKPCYD